MATGPRVRVQVDRAALTRFLAGPALAAADQAADRVLARAQDTAPVVTGDYRAGLTKEHGTDAAGAPAVRVGSTVPYAPFVEAEHGTIVRATSAAGGPG